MRFDRDQLRYLALMALEEIADECADGPVKRSLWLRFLLAWLYRESGADPAKKWLFDDFWQAATSLDRCQEHNQFLTDYGRHTKLEACLNGITRAVGWERTVTFMHEMQRRRRAD